MDYINVAYHKEFEKPIAVSHSWGGLIELICEYLGTSLDQLTFHPYNSKYPDEYQGYFEHTDVDGELHTIKAYEVDFK
jgi:hypothetical protein